MRSLKIVGDDKDRSGANQKRLFFAIDLPGKTIDSVDNLIKDFNDIPPQYMRWIAPSNLHISIKFLGEVDNKDVEPICKAAEHAFSSCPPMQLTVEGMGIFPNHDRPRVVWLGVGGDTEPLAKMESALSRELEKFGFQPDQRSFTAHLTIGRVKNDNVRGKLVRLVRMHHGTSFGQAPVDYVTLYESKLSPGGAIYSVVKTFHLGGPADNNE